MPSFALRFGSGRPKVLSLYTLEYLAAGDSISFSENFLFIIWLAVE
jgi:hypothetical protein